jgi:hypothetical protein
MGKKIVLRRLFSLVFVAIFLFVPLSQLAKPQPATAAAKPAKKAPTTQTTSVAPPTTQATRAAFTTTVSPVVKVKARARANEGANGEARDGASTAGAFNSAVRIVSVVDSPNPLRIMIDGRVRVSSISSGNASSYLVVEPGKHTISLEGFPNFSQSISLVERAVVTVVIAGSMENRVFAVVIDDTMPTGNREVRLVNVSERATLARVDGKEVRLLPKGTSAPFGIQKKFVIEPDLSLVELPTSSVVTKTKGKKTATKKSEKLQIERVPLLAEDERLVTVLLVPDLPRDRVRILPVTPFDQSALANVVELALVAPPAKDKSALAKQLIVGLVLLMLTLVTLTTLASFRQRAMEDRVRNRLRGADTNLDELSI